jgi:hypothetical protein
LLPRGLGVSVVAVKALVLEDTRATEMYLALRERALLLDHLRPLPTQALFVDREMYMVHRLHFLPVACFLSFAFNSNTPFFVVVVIPSLSLGLRAMYCSQCLLAFGVQTFVSCPESIVRENHLRRIRGRWESSHALSRTAAFFRPPLPNIMILPP